MGVHGKLGRYHLYMNRYPRIIKFWGQILKSSNIVVILKLYNSLVASCNNGKTNLAKGLSMFMSCFHHQIMSEVTPRGGVNLNKKL